MKKKYESEILEVCHKDALGMFELGLISAGRMKEFDEICLTPQTPETAVPKERSKNIPAFAGSRKG